MKEIADNSVHLIITSPPYWQLKDYGIENQIGFNDSYEQYINNLNLVWNECYRVLHNGCRLCVNIGDQFARSVYYGRYKIIPIRTEIIKFCENIGFDYMGAIIWQKPTTMNTTGGATVMGSFPYPRNGIIKIDYEFILIFKKSGIPPKVLRELKEKSKLSKEEWNEYFSGHWNFNGEKQIEHLAMFPEELPKRLIKMFSFIEDTILDPFLGSGTTILAAKNLNRNSIGYEINEKFLSIIKEKVGINKRELFQSAIFEVVRQKPFSINWNSEIKKLSYQFKDPIKFDKKIDPRKLKFGSKIDFSKSSGQECFSIKKIISPEELILSNNIKIRLIGIKSKEKYFDNAMDFLKSKLKNQKVFLKFDNIKYDSEGNLLVYLFLKNKTFINAHLIKNGLVEVDSDLDYIYKDKFIKLKQ
ncbi:MAG: Modification methylase MjaI [candidate division TA06 bacterium 34_109]|uniref:Methyltransferase n=1 Tax=candidate division TA06 bacterium 34_109 TaxID=1635277 RepID=A0A101HZP1_UNCT6|nr:MAG: Modification methylase MjaI [candidate division TA06 bacterium 34_109]